MVDYSNLLGGGSPDFSGTRDFSNVQFPEKEKGFMDILSDPNIIRGLGETGAAISSGTPIGQAVGAGASNLVRRRAVQQAGERQSQQQQTLQQQLLQSLIEGKLLSDPKQNDAFDSMTLSGDGGVNLSMKQTPQPTQFLGEQLRQESIDPTRGSDLPDFL